MTLLMCVSLMPGWVEVLENIEHLVHDGHLAHTEDHEAHDGHDHEDVAAHEALEALEAEHGCTPMSHSCGCHVSVPVILADPPTFDPARRLVEDIRLPEFLARMVHRSNAPPVRPPIFA